MQLILKNIKIPVSLGAYEWERHHPRLIAVHILADYAAGDALTTDALTDTVDYAALERTLVGVAQERHYNLVETLVSALGAVVLAHPQVSRVVVEVEKPGVLAHAESVTIKEEFTR